MEQQNRLIKKLLLADYFIQQWYTFLDFKYPELNDFLADTSIVTVNKVMYFMCVASVEETNIGLFQTFDDWVALPKGSVCDSFYCDCNSLYCLESNDEKRFHLRPQIGVINNFADYAYQKVIPVKVNTAEEFKACICATFPLEAGMIDKGLKRIITLPYLNRLIVNNLSEDLVKVNCQLPLWWEAFQSKVNTIRVNHLDYVKIEKKRLFNLK